MSKELFNTRELPQGARVKLNLTVGGEIRMDEVVTFKKMDGMYGQWFTEDGIMLNFNGTFQKDGDFYIIIG